ncbi:hypothetical protein PINS_up009335 [Pythium insidiosum]|nr:hypothetical protein PINS_up009335 [Pythium insidiosum]
MVNQYGECVHQGQGGDNNDTDFRVAQARNLTVQPHNRSTEAAVPVPQSWHFPALAAAYCEKDDAICSAWAAAQRANSSNETIDSRFCIGTAGCVAISVCEASRSQLKRCYGERVSLPFNPSDSSLSPLAVYLGAVAMMLVLMWSFWCLTRPDRPREVASANAADTSSAVGQPYVQQHEDADTMDASLPRTQLDLSGWRIQRTERIEREKM